MFTTKFLALVGIILYVVTIGALLKNQLELQAAVELLQNTKTITIMPTVSVTPTLEATPTATLIPEPTKRIILITPAPTK